MNRHSVGVIVISLAIGIAIGVGVSALSKSRDAEQTLQPSLSQTVPAAIQRLRSFVPAGSIGIDTQSDDGKVHVLVATFFDSRRPPIELATDLEAALTAGLDGVLGLATTDLGELGVRISIVYREPVSDDLVVFAHANVSKEADGEEQSRYTISLTVTP